MSTCRRCIRCSCWTTRRLVHFRDRHHLGYTCRLDTQSRNSGQFELDNAPSRIACKMTGPRSSDIALLHMHPRTHYWYLRQCHNALPDKDQSKMMTVSFQCRTARRHKTNNLTSHNCLCTDQQDMPCRWIVLSCPGIGLGHNWSTE